MKLNFYSTKDYENQPRLPAPGKQTQSNPISKAKKMLRLQNRKANLRAATRTENNRNRRKGKKRTFGSKYKGVTWYKKGKLWAVRIMTNRKSKFIGYFKDEIEAAKAYDKAAIKHHGEFAGLNFES